MVKLNKINQILLFILIVFILLHFGSAFLIPLIFGIFFASLMMPLSNILEKIRVNRIFSSLLSTLVIFIVVGGILYIFVYQLSLFVADISAFRDEIIMLIQNIQNKITSAIGLSLEEQENLWKNRSDDILYAIERGLTRFLGNIFNTSAGFLLVLVYMFLLLYYRDKFSDSILRSVNKEKEEETKEVLNKTSKIVYHYLWGRAQVMALLGIMYYITFVIFDIPYAGFLTIFGALVTIIPYLGPFISGILPVLFAIIYLQNLQIILLFTIIIITIQLVESYVFEPLIIGHEVKINPLVVIVAITLGGMIWGLAGMILFVPIFAIIKIISHHTPGLEPVAYFLGPSRHPRDKNKKQNN